MFFDLYIGVRYEKEGKASFFYNMRLALLIYNLYILFHNCNEYFNYEKTK